MSLVDKLIGAVAKKIKRELGEKAEVYTEGVYQNAVKPCFFVECEKSERMEMLNRRFFVRVHVAVIYENDGDEKRCDAESITATLFDLLARIDADEVCFNGRKIYGKWENGRLVIRALYDMWPQWESEECTLMEAIEVKEMYDGRAIYEG